MPIRLLRRIKNRLSRQIAPPAPVAPQAAPDTTPARRIFLQRPDDHELDGGYSAAELNDYIITKTSLWMEQANRESLALQPHLFGLLFVLETARIALGKPLRVRDFGGGAPVVPWIASQLSVGIFEDYTIIEQEAFVQRTPPAWRAFANYDCEMSDTPFDVMVISSVLPYIDRELAEAIFDNIRATRPKFVFLGRTSFLPDDYPDDECYTIQESSFKDHGPQIATGLDLIERQIARYPRRHFKRAAVNDKLTAMGYRRKISLSDDSGVERIDELRLFADNALWELQP